MAISHSHWHPITQAKVQSPNMAGVSRHIKKQCCTYPRCSPNCKPPVTSPPINYLVKDDRKDVAYSDLSVFFQGKEFYPPQAHGWLYLAGTAGGNCDHRFAGRLRRPEILCAIGQIGSHRRQSTNRS